MKSVSGNFKISHLIITPIYQVDDKIKLNELSLYVNSQNRFTSIKYFIYKTLIEGF